MAIPIYNQQVAPPHKPSRRGIAGAEARAAGQLAGEVEQIGTAFAGKLFELAASNELQDALITADQRWRDFASQLQKDPAYTNYVPQFESFYTGLREELMAQLKMPRAKRDLETRLKTAKVEWSEQISGYSDRRAIDHSRTVLIRGINDDLVNLDSKTLNTRVGQAIAGRIVTEQDGEHMRQIALVQIHASTLGFPGAVTWLSTEEPTAQYGVSREERLGLLSQYRSEWAVLREQEQKTLAVEIDRVELDFIDRLQKGPPPGWEEIRDSALPMERKEHFRGLLNALTEQQLKGEETRRKTEAAEQERLQKEKASEAYLKAYSQLVDYPLNREEVWEDRVLSDPLLSNTEKEHLVDEYRQRVKDASSAAKKKTPLEITDDSTMAELITLFFDTEKSNDEVKAFILDKHGRGLSNTDTKTWLDQLRTRAPYHSQKLAVDMIKGFFDDVLRDETSETRAFELRTEEAKILKELADTINRGELTEKGILEYSTNLLAGSKERQVSRAVRRLAVPEPERKPRSPEQTYRAEMVQRFTDWSGSAPVKTDVVYGDLAFSDGKAWYRYYRRSWQRWEDKTWVTAK